MANKIYPCLWFDGNAAEAAAFYCGLFRDSRILQQHPMVVTFESSGMKFMCLNGGPQFSFTPAMSFFVICETREELDGYWAALSEGGSVMMPVDTYDWSERYGWVKDRFGVNWQLFLGSIENFGQKFIPSLMFTGDQTGRAEEAMENYRSIFNNSSLVSLQRYPAHQQDAGLVMYEQFRLEGQTFTAMDSGMMHGFGFTEAISLVVDCENQEEIDHYWGRLTEGGQEGNCGWLKDRYGVSWQVVPSVLGKLMTDPERAGRVMQVFMKMKKFNIKELVDA